MAKLKNEYTKELTERTFTDTPKAVFAAIALSPFINGADPSGRNPDYVTRDEYILSEWKLLYEQGIVPQKPPVEIDLEVLTNRGVSVA